MSNSITVDYQTHGTKALLLGSGELGKEVAIELLRYGIEVTACDRYDNAPAMQVAQHKAIINMRDPQELENLIVSLHPDYIIPEIEAISTETLVALEEKGYNVVPSAHAANITMNREAIRTLAAEELSLPTSAYFFASTIEEIKENIHKIGFPCIMKPIMSSSGKGQSVLKSEADIENAFAEACEHGRGGIKRVIVPGCVQFDKEITLRTVNAVDGIHFCEAVGHHQVNGDYHESWQPEELSEEVLLESKRIASSVVSALGGYGLFGVELFICGNKVIFSELSPRPHDTGMVTMISQDLSEFALHVRALLGLPIGKISFNGPSASAAFAVAPSSQVRIFGKPDIDGERRLGVCLARGKSVTEAVENVKKMRSLINIDIE